ncbi:MAG: flagellar hook-length control protein FliK [Proteobacteria bacterium]|nr:flagellar hook-length control protein FliK [Pseudomonadota bacterium]MBU1708426.1 flagellar hook-length control protein FliK [Pseudomonadota bacterium]
MKIGDLFPIKGAVSDRQAPVTANKPAVNALGEMKLVPGQVLKGTVLSSTADGKTFLDINGKIIAASSRVPLPVGGDVWLEVQQTGTTPWFSLAGKKGAALEFLRLVMADGSSIGKAIGDLSQQGANTHFPDSILNKFQSFFQQFSEGAIGDKADQDQLIRVISWLNKGSLYQGKSGGRQMHIGQLIEELAAALSGSGLNEPGNNNAAGLKKLAGMFEQLHVFNAQEPSQGKQPVMLYPFWFASGGGWGEWLFSAEDYNQSTGQESNSGYSLQFFMNMSRIGQVSMKVHLQDKQLSGELYVADQGIRDFIVKGLPELREMLESYGFSPVDIHCSTSRENLVQLIKESIQEKIGLESYAVLDIRA